MYHNFFKCGITGLCLEVTYTSLISFLRKDLKMTATTSLLMFPIYGGAVCLTPLCRSLKHHSPILRGTVYMLLIYCGEYTSGIFLKKRNMCPWDYSHCPFNISGVIRLDFAPLWFGAGLLFERLLLPDPDQPHLRLPV